MEEKEIKETVVELKGKELEEYRRWQATRERKSSMEVYNELVDEAISEVLPQYRAASDILKSLKSKTLDTFASVISMKREVLGLSKEEGQWSHTFTNSEGTARIILGVNTTDGYRDTVNEGIDLVTRYIKSLATDEKSQQMAGMLLRLLAKDARGSLKAGQVIKLRRYAEESGSEDFISGVELIEDSYQPSATKMYVRVQERSDRSGEWQSVPLSVTDVSTEEDPGVTFGIPGAKSDPSDPSDPSDTTEEE